MLSQPRKTQEEKSRETREKIISATIAMISESGFSGVTTPRVAELAGVSRGALQYHFSSKDDLVTEAVYEISYRVDEDFQLDKVATAPLPERISYVIDKYWSHYGSDLYLAALEIVITSRFDKGFTDRLGDRFFSNLSNRDLEWLELFSDTGASSEERVSLRRLVLDVMRGMAMRAVISNRAAGSREVELLKQVVLERLSRQ